MLSRTERMGRGTDRDAVGSRLKKARAVRGMSQSTVAKHMRVTRGAVGQWEVGATAPTRDNLNKLASLYRVGYDWLATGKGTPPDPSAAPVIRTAPAMETPGAERVAELDVRAGMGGGGLLENEVRQDGQYLDAVKPEPWLLPRSFVRDVLRVPPDRLVVLETQGDSMSPTIESGTRVIVDTGHKLPTPDGVFALRDRYDMVVVKRLQARRDAPRVRVISDNPNHEDEEVGADEIAILGRVLCALKLV